MLIERVHPQPSISLVPYDCVRSETFFEQSQFANDPLEFEVEGEKKFLISEKALSFIR